jgi:toxin ParE1/3/4
VATRRAAKGRRSRKVVWTDRALRDLAQIDDYIAADDPRAAERWIDKLVAAAERAGRLPGAGRMVRERKRPDLREVLVRTYRIVYRVRGAQIEILTVFEGHMRLPEDVAPR